ncbi:MAG TPA: aminopeptidase P family protein [Bacteroidales bacterium]|nr:aminopeptidase P family protein [Bacteroidales bacterium]
MKTKDKIEQLRVIMASNGIAAYIAPSSDPHLSEYLPDCWKFRAWLSGFTGSAGTLVVTANAAALWTDSRYFLQAEQELKGTGIELCKMGLTNTPSIEDWLAQNLDKNQTVGFDGRLLSHAQSLTLMSSLKSKGLKANPKIDIINNVWNNRPTMPNSKAFEHELRYAGQTISEKLTLIRQELENCKANACILSALDEVAWAFNIRGNDIDYNPVVMAYGLITNKDATLFIDSDKLSDEHAKSLIEQGVTLKPYAKIEKAIKSASNEMIFALDEARVNHRLYSLIPKDLKKVNTLSLVTKLKAQKNPIELENIRQSHVNDGVAMCKFLHWLENSVANEKITELSIAAKLLALRKEQEGFISESFSTIAGYRENGAIVHYSATPETAKEIKPEGFLLVDSGGQYLQGTTDITRTIRLGEPTPEEKEDYTLVLKGMIQLSMAQFPAGTRGSQLDTLARMAMWSKGINYGHGTGHGVGAFLNVHEGPQSIRPNENPVTIEPGMIQSNEPGIYRAGKYGIRIENLILCREAMETESGKFYSFETLTLCPIDLKPVDIESLSKEEKDWLNAYHKTVYEKISPKLTEELKVWLKEKTQEI